jgi:AraC family transcriptional regulator, regulatory protein of adaptative response / DNA-3-methyladenine glycosylase II
VSDFRQMKVGNRATLKAVLPAFDHCYRAVQSRDARFDGWFVTAVTSTRIYCRPSCPAITPKPENVRFYPTAAGAQAAGFRACKRCRPDATPGSPEWNVRADLVGRAMRLIADGIVDREGVHGLARRLGYSERHINRTLLTEVGAGPIALARAQRAHTARVLIETTELPFADVCFAAGFASIRQFNDTVRDVFDANPRELRAAHSGRTTRTTGVLSLRLATREPFAGEEIIRFLGARRVRGVEAVEDRTFRRALNLPRGWGIVALTPFADHVRAELRLEDLRDLTTAVQRCRRLFDLDADPVAVHDALHDDPMIGTDVRRHPGRRVPGHPDPAELAVRAVLGQQVSVAGARTLTARLVARAGTELDDVVLTHLFPTPAAIAAADLRGVGLTTARARTITRLAEALERGDVVLDAGADRDSARCSLMALPGIGSWTADYIALRALGDPDAFLASDLGVRRAVERLGGDGSPAAVAALAERWRPWRAYALMYLWGTLDH